MSHAAGERRFRVALTGDFFDPSGALRFADIGRDVLEGQDRIELKGFAEHRPTIGPDQVGDANGLIVLTPAVTAASLADRPDLLAVGRFGVGFDAVDVEACTSADVVAFIAAGAVDRPVAEACVAWMLALTHHLRIKDALVRAGRWDERTRYMGSELRGRTLGIIGLGGIGRELVRLLTGFGMSRPIAFDPFVEPAVAEALGVRLVGLDELLKSADFVTIHCPLTDRTRGLIGARELALMRPDTYLINTARGGIVDEDALFDALTTGRLAGAAVDCFAEEPLTRPPRLGELENVILAPHSIAWTAELFRDIGRAVLGGMLELTHGRRPRGVVNPEVFQRAGFRWKWARLIGVVGDPENPEARAPAH